MMINSKNQSTEKSRPTQQSEKWADYNPLVMVQKKDVSIKILKKSQKVQKKAMVQNPTPIQKPIMLASLFQKKNPIMKQTVLQKPQYNPFQINKQIKKTKTTKKYTVSSPQLKQSFKSSYNDDALEKIINNVSDEKISLKEPEVTQKMYVCKRCVFVYKNVEIPICLMSQSIPTIKYFSESKLTLKLHPAAETIQFLINNNRSLNYGIIQYDYSVNNSQNQSLLHNLSEQLLQKDQLFAHKYDEGNAVFCLMNRKQIQIILQSRKQTISINKTAIIIKEWVNENYLRWWSDNYEWVDHNLFYLIFYKYPIAQITTPECITVQSPKNYPYILKYRSQKPKQTNENQITNHQLHQPIFQDFNIFNSFMSQNPFILEMLNKPQLQNQKSNESLLSFEGSRSPITEEGQSCAQNEQEITNITRPQDKSGNFEFTDIYVQMEDDERFQEIPRIIEQK